MTIDPIEVASAFAGEPRSTVDIDIRDYPDDGARILGVSDLLERALTEP